MSQDRDRDIAAWEALGQLRHLFAADSDIHWNPASTFEFKILEILERAVDAGHAAGAAEERAAIWRAAASMARNCVHTCMTEAHCDFLHAAHNRLADEFERKAGAHLACAPRAEEEP